MGHEFAIKFDLVPRVDRLLTIERQTVSILGDGDLGQKGFCWNATFDDVWRGRGLDAPSSFLKAYLVRDDDTELGRDNIQPFGDVFSDQDLLLARVFRQFLGLDHYLDAFKMGSMRKCGAQTKLPSMIQRPSSDFLEDGQISKRQKNEKTPQLLMLPPFGDPGFCRTWTSWPP